MRKLHFVVSLLTMTFVVNIIFASFACAEEVSSSHIKENNFELSFNGEIGVMHPEKSSYLGTQIGAGPNVFNFVEVDDDLDIKATGASLGYTPFIGLKIIGGFEEGRADDNKIFETLDASGDNLIIPGVGVGPSGAGFFLPGPNNQITEGTYQTRFDYHRFTLGLESDIKMSNPSLKVSPSFHIDYSKATTKNLFLGNIPFFIRSFAYDTKTEVKTISPVIGLDLSYRLTPLLEIFGGAKYAYDFNDGKGKDNLTFTGFGTQTANIKSNKNTRSYGLKTGLVLNSDGPATVTFQGNYKNLGNSPVMKIRDGSNVSDFSYKDVDVYSGTVRATFKF